MLSVRLDKECDEYLRKLADLEDRSINNLIKRMILEHKRYNPLAEDGGILQLERGVKHAFMIVLDGKVVGTLNRGPGGLLALELDTTNLGSPVPHWSKDLPSGAVTD
jgi:hypothetical protein